MVLAQIGCATFAESQERKRLRREMMPALLAGFSPNKETALRFAHLPDTVNDRQRADTVFELDRHSTPLRDPEKSPAMEPGDGHVLVCALLGVTIGAALGVAVGLTTAAYIAIIVGIIGGGILGSVVGDRIKRHFTKPSRTERQP